MDGLSVRLKEVTIQNFKNVEKGRLTFEGRKNHWRASVLGLYGQNGSGKTALIDAIQLLKYALSGRRIPDGARDYIRLGAESATLEFVFDMSDSDRKVGVFYSFSVKSGSEVTSGEDYAKAVICDEMLKYSYESQYESVRKTLLIDASRGKVFAPESKYNFLIKGDGIDLLVAKKMALSASRSFIFSREMSNALEKQRDERGGDDEFIRYADIIRRMGIYGTRELFVINTVNSGMISMAVQPLAFRYEGLKNAAAGYLILNLDKPTVIPEGVEKIIVKTFEQMNVVLRQVVPGLSIGVRDLGTELMDKGEVGKKVELVSEKGDTSIPLRCESEGIKKIVSVLQLLIVVYNNPSITVAVDELDSGIFEYLLGELLRIISEEGKGQLIFTSHNLRPLETLDRGFVAFTTTNPANRYVRMANVKDNNNLRDYYYRDIVLGTQDEELYEPTNNAEISFAFREVGEVYGS